METVAAGVRSVASSVWRAGVLFLGSLASGSRLLDIKIIFFQIQYEQAMKGMQMNPMGLAHGTHPPPPPPEESGQQGNFRGGRGGRGAFRGSPRAGRGGQRGGGNQNWGGNQQTQSWAGNNQQDFGGNQQQNWNKNQHQQNNFGNDDLLYLMEPCL